MNWSHKSLEAAGTHSADSTRVLKGSTVVAWLRPAAGGYRVTTPNRRLVGIATSPGEALLMMVRDEEAPRCRR